MENNTDNVKNMLLGLIIGGLAGSVVMLLFAPQSGKRTRAQIQLKSNQILDRTTDMVNKEIEQVRSNTQNIITSVQEKADHLKQLGQDQLVKQLDHVSNVLDAGKTAIETA
jgi:gas vesicle protein